VVKKPRYKAGDTLRLILPFLKTYGATNEKIREYSAEHVLLVPGAKETLKFVKDVMPSFIVSTSYEHYIVALCDLTDFPFENVYCTRLNLDKYKIDVKEIRRLKGISEEICAMPMIEIPENAKSVHDFSKRDQKTIRRLDEIFWKEIPKMKPGRMLEEINPVGGYEKANAVQDTVKNLDSGLPNVMYVGDSITDVQPFQLVRENRGLTVSFNGNNYAVREAEIAVLSDNTILTSVLAEVFNHYGKKGVFELVEEWSYSELKRYCSPILQSQILRLYPKTLPKVEIITSVNRERLMKESTAFRKTIRGEDVGGLG
jgi:energy-converting hydrogenase A subunit R